MDDIWHPEQCPPGRMQDVLPIPIFSLPFLAALGYGWTVAVACGMSWLSPAWVDDKRSFSEQVFSGRKFCFSKPNPSMCNSASCGRCVLFLKKSAKHPQRLHRLRVAPATPGIVWAQHHQHLLLPLLLTWTVPTKQFSSGCGSGAWGFSLCFPSG